MNKAFSLGAQENSPLEKTELNYGISMIVIKPSGECSDVASVISDIFDKSENGEPSKLAISTINTIVKDNGSDAKELLGVIGKTHIRVSIDSRFNRQTSKDETSFWLANYGHHVDKYYFNSLINSNQGPFTAYFIEYDGPQDELDSAINVLKGRTTLTSEIGDVLFAGRGIRGLYRAEAITLNQSLIDRIRKEYPDVAKQLDIIMVNSGNILFTKIPEELQRFIFGVLTDKQRESLMSNTIHSPDNRDVAFNSLKAMCNQYLNPTIVKRLLEIEQKNLSQASYWMLNALEDALSTYL